MIQGLGKADGLFTKCFGFLYLTESGQESFSENHYRPYYILESLQSRRGLSPRQRLPRLTSQIFMTTEVRRHRVDERGQRCESR